MAEENNGGWGTRSGQPQGAPQATPAPSVDETAANPGVPADAAAEAQGASAPSETPTVQGDQFTMTLHDDGATQTIPAATPADDTDTAVHPAQPSAGEAPTSQYRPAPEYGAYGPTPAQPAETRTQQPTPSPQAPQGDRNPYSGNPFLAQLGQQGQAGQSGAAQNAGQQPGPNNPYAPQGPNAPQGPGFPPAPGAHNRPNRGGARTVSGVIIAVVAALVSAALCLGVGYLALTEGWVRVPTTSSLQNVNSNQSGSGSATVEGGDAVDWTDVAANVSDSVVSIQTQVQGGTAAGSGAILDTDGHIVTNNHVISGAQSIQVTLSNGQMYTAQVVGTDTTTDIAVIQLDNAPDGLTPVEFADSDQLAVGEPVMAIGNPLGYDDTATTGIVSALNRPVSVMDDNNSEVVTNAVQIDAAINPGNSGGPTFNAAGQVIGINSSIASTASSSSEAGSIGIGFAIPANLVKRIANEIISDGSATHVALGVTITSSTVEADGVTRGGARITTPSTGGSAVVSGSPADKAGLRAEDTIVAYNGNAVNNNYSLLGYIRAAALGDTATLTIVRSGQTMDIDVTLDQEEASVNGSSGSGQDDSGQSDGQQNQDGGDGYGDGGFYDPFGLW